MRPRRRCLALLLCLLGLATPAFLLSVPADGADRVVLDYTGSLNCESDLWNNENYLETPAPPSDW